MRQLHHASQSPRVRYPPKQRLRASATIYLSTPPLCNPPLPPPASARQVLRASATLVEGQRNAWRAAPRVKYLPRADVGWRLRASGTPRVRYLPDRGPARQLLAIYPPPPPPLAALSYSPWRIDEYVASGSARQVLRASATCRERSERM